MIKEDIISLPSVMNKNVMKICAHIYDSVMHMS